MDAGIVESLLRAEYKFAKTMPEHPHWYTLRRTWRDDDAFCRAVQYIRDVGYTEQFKKTKYTMFNLNGFKYWTMGAPINRNGQPHTILINRAEINDRAAYDEIAEDYAKLFHDEESQRENAEIAELIQLRPHERVLDIGCGPGTLLDMFPGHRNYVGLDPSRKMLQHLRQGHPGSQTINAKFEEFWGGRFDLIISLFGSISYVDPRSLYRISDMLTPGGRFFGMFFQEGYVPVTYIQTGVILQHFNLSDYDLTAFKQTTYKETFLIAEYTEPV